MGVRRWLAAAVVAGVVAAGCSAVGPDQDVDLDGTWVLVSGSTADGPLAVTPGARVSLTFDDDGLGGKGPCNDYGADYDLDGASFDVSGPGIEQTFAGCVDEALGALESAYLSALNAVDTVTRDGSALTMTGEDVELGLRLEEPFPRADVVDQRWLLVSWTDESGADHRPEWEPGQRPFVRFGDSGGVGGRVSASTGCRALEGRWRMWRGAPHITRASWRGTCPDRLMDQEMTIGNALSEPVVELRGSGRGSELVLRYAHASSPAEVVYRR